MTHIKKPKETFIMNFKLHERLAWKMAAGDKGAILYEFYTWKNEMLKRMRRTKNNFYIPMSNLAMREHGFGMHRETKVNAIWKLKTAKLIDVQKERGGTYQICKLT